jgi:hypothetical protein
VCAGNPVASIALLRQSEYSLLNQIFGDKDCLLFLIMYLFRSVWPAFQRQTAFEK